MDREIDGQKYIWIEKLMDRTIDEQKDIWIEGQMVRKWIER